jgi:hypothetical protein
MVERPGVTPAGDSVPTGWIPAAYPMVDETAATGRVAQVYADILERFPMVPSLFKSLAVCPGYLQLAWEQTLGILGDDEFVEATERLVAGVADAVPAPPQPAVRQLVGGFIEPLARMLIVAAGLWLALDDAVSGRPQPHPRPPRPTARARSCRCHLPKSSIRARSVPSARTWRHRS